MGDLRKYWCICHFPQIYETYIFLILKILILLTEICLEIEDIFKFDSLEARTFNILLYVLFGNFPLNFQL
jgi:hypothetical protein